MKLSALVVLVFLVVSSCTSSDEYIVVCTKTECCCPDSLVIDVWDGFLGLTASKPVVLKGDAKWDAINAINAAEPEGFLKDEPEYVIRAWYPGGSNPRIFRIVGPFVKDDLHDWCDTGYEDFGRQLMQGHALTK